MYNEDKERRKYEGMARMKARRRLRNATLSEASRLGPLRLSATPRLGGRCTATWPPVASSNSATLLAIHEYHNIYHHRGRTAPMAGCDNGQFRSGAKSEWSVGDCCRCLFARDALGFFHRLAWNAEQ